ncbi:MAG: 6-bladed beta-propeller [SAR202 cluster bacterium]|nr:6-bladed beta-propeller [SAR202 cluster bacterium]
MARPYGLLRAGFPYLKSLGMRRLTNFPVDIALGAEGRMYILCRQESAALVRRYSFEDKDLGNFGEVGDAEGKLQWPVSIAADRNENLYISDEALDRVSAFTSEGTFLKCWGESGSKNGQLRRPAGLAFDANGDLHVVDSLNHRVQKFTKDGKHILSWGSHGDGDGQFDMPWGITVDDAGDVYVADWRNDRVQKFNRDGEFILKFGKSGSGDGEFNRPTDVAVDADGDIYVCDRGNDRVQLFNSEPRYVEKFIGDATLSQIARDYMLTNASPNRIRDMAVLEPQKRLRQPKGIAVDAQGRLYITDTGSYRVQVYQKEVIRLEPHQFAPPMRSVTLHQE